MSTEGLAEQDMCSWRQETTLRTLSEIEAVVSAVADAMHAADYARADVFAMRLALDEAICNAVKHGNRNDPTKKVSVRCHVTRDLVRTEIEDEGDGFDPHHVPDPCQQENLERPCGRGLLLMHRYAARVRFNDRGNHVTLIRYRSAE
ncbi:MAG TPA: ATP-binding protein [Gemmataceae bacterium]|nr:ATP-binding protein [Gemmataceae bacterium]